MIEREQTKTVVARGIWEIPENLTEVVDPYTYRKTGNTSFADNSLTAHTVHFCFRDILANQDPIERPKGNWPSPELVNAMQLVVLTMIKNDYSIFQMAFPQYNEREASAHDWSNRLKVPFINSDDADVETEHEETLPIPENLELVGDREYKFYAIRSQIPSTVPGETTERIAMSIRRTNLPHIDFSEDFAVEY